MDAEGIYEALVLAHPGGGGFREHTRPYVSINMVASLDGKTTLHGKAARIGSRIDRRVMRTLRSKADAVMVGANTLRAERLSLGLDGPQSGPQPLAIIVSKAGDVPLEGNLLIPDGGQSVLMIVAADAPESAAGRLPLGGRLLRAPATPSGGVDLAQALSILKAEHAVDSLLVEGGPSLNHSLISQGLAAELFLTLAPKLLGGATTSGALTLLEGPELLPLARSPEPQLVSAYLAENELYLRYLLSRPTASQAST